ncbi:murein hydrolase activator EnvC family protein [Thermodesulfobacteriota bacterium]
MIKLTVSVTLIFMAVVFFGGELRADDLIKKDKTRLENAKKEIKEREKVINKLKSKEKSVFDRLKSIQVALTRRQSELSKVMDDRIVLLSKIDSTIIEVEVLNEKVRLQKEYIEKRMVALYRLSDMQYLKILFSSSSYVDMLKRYKFLKLILNQDSKLVDEYIENTQALTIKENELKKEKEILDETVKKVKNKELEVLAERNSKKVLLRNVRREKDYYRKALKELNDAATKLEGLILKLSKDVVRSNKSYTENFRDFKNVLEPPTDAKVVSFFGKEFVSKLDSYLFNNGIRFGSETGQDVRSVFSGEVIYADWFRGYGNVIIISHAGGYFTIYSHLQELRKKTGEKVKRGDIIALSGDTGSLTGACLYFEIRYKGGSVDPLNWLMPTVKSLKNSQYKTR